jgi:tetratricopeptide (TPR) repeat protein
MLFILLSNHCLAMRKFVLPFKSILLAILMMYSVLGYTQNNTRDSLRIDSLKKVLQTQEDDTNKVNTLIELSKNLARSEHGENAFQYASNASLLAEKINFPGGKGKAVNLIGLIYRSQKNYPGSLHNYFAAIKIFEETGDNQQAGNTYLEVASILYYNVENYPEALQNCFSGLKCFEELGDNWEIADCHLLLGMIYNAQAEESTALKNLLESLKTFETIGDSIKVAYTDNVIGELYRNQGKYEQALQTHFVALKFYEALGSRGPNFGVAWTYGEIGEVFEKLGEKSLVEGDTLSASEKFSQALTYYERRLNLERVGNMGPSESSSNDLGNIYMQLSKISSPDIKAQRLLIAKSYLEKGLQASMAMGNKDGIKSSYQSLVKTDSMLGDYKQAFEHYRLYILYRDSLVNETATKKSLQLKMQYESDKKDAAAKAELQERNLIIAAILLLGAIALLVINRQRLKLKYRQKLLEQDKLRVEQEMESATEQLKMFTQNIVEKTSLIDKLEQQVKANEYNADKNQLIEELSHQTILTDDDWLTFKALFEKTHPGFFTKLKEQANDITVAEQRMAALTRLHLTTKQMAAVLGISPNSVNKAKQRLRLRVNLKPEENIEKLISEI